MAEKAHFSFTVAHSLGLILTALDITQFLQAASLNYNAITIQLIMYDKLLKPNSKCKVSFHLI